MSAKIKQVFGQTPKVFRNSSLIYSNEIGSVVASMGFKGILTEGAKHVLGWKSPHYVYHCAYNPNLKILLRDFKLSDDISLRFSNSDWSEYPLFADKYIGWLLVCQKKNRLSIFLWNFRLWVSHSLCLPIFCNSSKRCRLVQRKKAFLSLLRLKSLRNLSRSTRLSSLSFVLGR